MMDIQFVILFKQRPWLHVTNFTKERYIDLDIFLSQTISKIFVIKMCKSRLKKSGLDKHLVHKYQNIYF